MAASIQNEAMELKFEYLGEKLKDLHKLFFQKYLLFEPHTLRYMTTWQVSPQHQYLRLSAQKVITGKIF